MFKKQIEKRGGVGGFEYERSACMSEGQIRHFSMQGGRKGERGQMVTWAHRAPRVQSFQPTTTSWEIYPQNKYKEKGSCGATQLSSHWLLS